MRDGAGQSGKITNRLLRSLPPEAFDRLSPHLRELDLPHGHLIGRPDEPIDYVHFVESGLVSLVQRMDDGRVVEVAAIGPDGVLDPFSICGIERVCLESVVQTPATVFQLPCTVFLAEAAGIESVRRVLTAYARYVIRLIAQISACNRLHSIKQRSCRWLLTARDCARSDRFYLTHEFLAEMLGVQRSGVSVAANELKSAGLIEYTHGRVTVIDGKGLKRRSCPCYSEACEALEAVFAVPT
jgi:CRP-like cAMP-binding protein